jgi:hypothetical protein
VGIEVFKNPKTGKTTFRSDITLMKLKKLSGAVQADSIKTRVESAPSFSV